MTDQKSYVLLTGCTGLVGFAIVNELLKKGFLPILLVRKTSFISKFNHLRDQLRFIETDFSEESFMQIFSLLKEEQILVDATIYALGATKAKNEQQYNQINVGILRLFCKASKQTFFSYGRLLFISSLSVHGPQKESTSVIDSQTNFNPLTYYAKSKLLAERYITNHLDNYIIFRPAAVFGRYDQETLVLYKMINKGIHIYFADKNNTVGIINADELAIHIVTSIRWREKNQTLISCTHNISVLTYTQLIAECIPKERRLQILFPKWALFILAGVYQFLCQLFLGRFPMFNVQKVKELTGKSWTCTTNDYYKIVQQQPSYSLLCERIEATVEWYKKNQWL